ncbi:AraC family transcriptional regulator [Mangrovibacterium lignilyticum]|uniref:AraC family transcriptional regulator n=1 Tax=Mangrovibacterium lignilyticum TaxID=2668052 RepID=UPI0013D8B8A4|nr:AraC family transcriptional regulator [Mangrovibacterium lignilyticum]
MKAVRFVIPKTGGNSFRVQLDDGPHFYDTIHYHPEHQITFIIKGEGTSFIGNHVERFVPGDVYLIGKNVPHVSKCDGVYYQGDLDLDVFSISLFFKDETFGSQFFEIPEMAHIKRLLEQASMGVKVFGDDREQIAKLIEASREQDGFQRFQNLMSILNIFAKSENTKTLSSVRYITPSKEADNERINVIFNFLSTNFKSDISLDQISSIASMTPNAFCRYFKQRTGKSYSVFLNEMRVEYAGKQIAGSHHSFGNIAVESGFNSISYFNRQFKRVTGLSPLQYRKKFGQHIG